MFVVVVRGPGVPDGVSVYDSLEALTEDFDTVPLPFGYTADVYDVEDADGIAGVLFAGVVADGV